MIYWLFKFEMVWVQQMPVCVGGFWSLIIFESLRFGCSWERLKYNIKASFSNTDKSLKLIKVSIFNENVSEQVEQKRSETD